MRIINLSVTYPKVKIDFPDYEFFRGVTVISGRNGSGKTTLFKAIAGLLDYDGEVENNLSVTYVSQEPIMFNKTVLENISYSKTIKNEDINTDLIAKLAKQFNIYDILNKNAHQLSGGEKVKVGIIRGIIFDPDILLLDEPTTHLDLESIEELVNIVNELKSKMDIFIISHNRSFIEEVKDHEYRLGDENV